MTYNEKRLVLFAILIFLIYVVPFELAPIGYDWYKDERQRIEKLEDDIERYKKLADDAELWKTKHQQALQKRDEINASLLQGNNREVVNARMQALLKQIAQETGIVVKTLDLPEYSRTGEWVLVTQAIQFESNGQAIFLFLQRLNAVKERLIVVGLEVRLARDNLLSGTLKVTGFSRLPVTETQTSTTKS